MPQQAVVISGTSMRASISGKMTSCRRVVGVDRPAALREQAPVALAGVWLAFAPAAAPGDGDAEAVPREPVGPLRSVEAAGPAFGVVQVVRCMIEADPEREPVAMGLVQVQQAVP
jgi:hypothetical protein